MDLRCGIILHIQVVQHSSEESTEEGGRLGARNDQSRDSTLKMEEEVKHCKVKPRIVSSFQKLEQNLP